MPIAAAAQASEVACVPPLFRLLLTGVVMFRWSRRSKVRTSWRLDQVTRELGMLRNQILPVTTSAIPDGRPVQPQGYVESLSDTGDASDRDSPLAHKQALLLLARQGRGAADDGERRAR